MKYVCVLVNTFLFSLSHTEDVSLGGGPTGLLLNDSFGREASFAIRGAADQMAQEGDEVFTIPLSVTSQNPPVFVAGPATVTVVDTTGEYPQLLYVHIDCFKYLIFVHE